MSEENRWFRVPTEDIERTDDDGNVVSTTSGPKYRTLDGVTGFSGNTIGNSPQWVVRFYSDQSTLDNIASETDTTQLTTSEAAQRFENATGQSQNPDKDWDTSGVKNSFQVNN